LKFIAVFVLLIQLFLLAAWGEEGKSDLPPLNEGTSSLSEMTGEDLSYDIAFLWFDHLAEGRLSFRQTEIPRIYEAVLDARTLGVAAWLTRDREHRYVSRMEELPGGMLQSLSYESRIIKGKGKGRQDRTNAYQFDHENGTIVYRRARDGVFYKEETFSMSGDSPNDVLTALYNFRAGHFGPIVQGARYSIPTYSRNGSPVIVVEVLTDEQRKSHPLFPEGGILCRALPSAEVFDTGGGWVYIWFDFAGRPARGIVENVIGIGDVKGTLREEVATGVQ